MDLTKFKPLELKNLLANHARQGQAQMVVDILIEMQRRGIATKKEYQNLEWNQVSVRNALAPFKAVAASIPNNKRTPYTEAGGLKIGKRKNDPEAFWINSYSAIKTSNFNAVFVCYVKRPGDEPSFVLELDGKVVSRFSADELALALEEWKSLQRNAP